MKNYYSAKLYSSISFRHIYQNVCQNSYASLHSSPVYPLSGLLSQNTNKLKIIVLYIEQFEHVKATTNVFSMIHTLWMKHGGQKQALICTVKTYLPFLITSAVSGLECQYNVNHYFFCIEILTQTFFSRAPITSISPLTKS